MNKLLIALPIIAFLSLGAVYLVSQNQTDLKDDSTYTIGDWEQCIQKLPNKQCTDISNDQVQLQQCYSAADKTAGLIEDGGNAELLACKKWNAYFQTSKASDELEYDYYFYYCFGNLNAVSAAKQSSYYYNNIYSPKYLGCGKIQGQ